MSDTFPAPVNAPRNEQLERAYHALGAGAGFRQLDDRLIVRVVGDDRVSFLHGMCTADVKGLPPGKIAPALFVTERAHVIAEFFLYALPDAFLIEIARDVWPAVRQHLDKFLVADDVEFEESATMQVTDFEGPGAAAIMAQFCGELPEAWHFNPARMIAQLPRYAAQAFTMLVDTDQCRAALERIDPAHELVNLSADALDLLRIENGLARVGVDTDEKTLALEARLDRSISLSKGCYIGQETLERATARGAIKRELRGVRVNDGRLPKVGSVIFADQKPVGILTSVARSPALGVIGLAIVHHSVWRDGTRVMIRSDSGPCEAGIAQLPFQHP
jgi:folate-binding protein YgfZ